MSVDTTTNSSQNSDQDLFLSAEENGSQEVPIQSTLNQKPQKKGFCAQFTSWFQTKQKPTLEIKNEETFRQRHPKIFAALIIAAIALAIIGAVAAIYFTVGFSAAGEWLQHAFAHDLTAMQGILYIGIPSVFGGLILTYGAFKVIQTIYNKPSVDPDDFYFIHADT